MDVGLVTGFINLEFSRRVCASCEIDRCSSFLRPLHRHVYPQRYVFGTTGKIFAEFKATPRAASQEPDRNNAGKQIGGVLRIKQAFLPFALLG